MILAAPITPRGLLLFLKKKTLKTHHTVAQGPGNGFVTRTSCAAPPTQPPLRLRRRLRHPESHRVTWTWTWRRSNGTSCCRPSSVALRRRPPCKRSTIFYVDSVSSGKDGILNSNWTVRPLVLMTNLKLQSENAKTRNWFMHWSVACAVTKCWFFLYLI